MRRLIDAPNSDLCGVLACILFTAPPKTRADRAEAARKDGFELADTKMREFLSGILQSYEALRETELATHKLGDVPTIRQAFVEVQRAF